MTLKEISEIFDIKIEKLYQEFNLDKNSVAERVKVKKLKNYNLSLTEDYIREKIAKIIGYNKTKKIFSI